jgi:hypothetical protein
MPTLLRARAAQDGGVERQVRTLAGSRPVPGAGIRRARLIVLRWEGTRTAARATALGCPVQTVRARLGRVTKDSAQATTVATTPRTARATPWVWGRPPPTPRTSRHRCVDSLAGTAA